MIERKLYWVSDELYRANENIIRLQETVKAMQQDNDKTHALQNFDIEDLKEDNKIFWNLMVDKTVPSKKRQTK